MKPPREYLTTVRASNSAAIYSQRHGYRHGYALKRHTASAHGGEFREDCPACNELKRKCERTA